MKNSKEETKEKAETLRDNLHEAITKTARRSARLNRQELINLMAESVVVINRFLNENNY